jgi:hypothetical protein
VLAPKKRPKSTFHNAYIVDLAYTVYSMHYNSIFARTYCGSGQNLYIMRFMHYYLMRYELVDCSTINVV